MMPIPECISGVSFLLSGGDLLASLGSTGMGDPEFENGLAIALAGLLIVFAVLIFLSLFIVVLPKLVAVLDSVLPAPDHSHADHSLAGGGHPESQLPDDVVIAAIGYVLHTELQNQRAKN